MKTKIHLLVTFFALLISSRLLAQQYQLTVLAVDTFPILPLDTAYEADQYYFNILVSNIGNTTVQVDDTMRVFLKNTDTTLANIETLGLVVIDSLVGGDTFNIPVFSYQFTPATYKTGNNIIVVWPKVGNFVGSTYDSLQIDTVYFVPLLSINMLNAQNQEFSFLPNPVSDQIVLNTDRKKYIDYVRILNDLGQTILFTRSAGKYLDVRFLSKGFYFIEIKERNGTLSRKKFLKL